MKQDVIKEVNELVKGVHDLRSEVKDMQTALDTTEQLKAMQQTVEDIKKSLASLEVKVNALSK